MSTRLPPPRAAPGPTLQVGGCETLFATQEESTNHARNASVAASDLNCAPGRRTGPDVRRAEHHRHPQPPHNPGIAPSQARLYTP
jgi:hypothetical protein